MTIINKTTKSVESQSHRAENWMGADWLEVPPALEGLAFSCAGYCGLVVEDGRLTDITPTERPEPVQTFEVQIFALKQQLTATDYQAIKYAEGFLSESDYAPVKAKRQAWRDEINRLELEAAV